MSEDPELTGQRMITRWVYARLTAEALAATDEINVPALADEGAKHFLEDEAFLDGPIQDLIRSWVYTAVAQRVAKTRGIVRLGDTVTTVEGAKRAVRAKSNRLWRLFEHVSNKHVRLPEMTREDLLAAAIERRKRGSAEYFYADLWETLAEKLEGGQRVRERFTADEVHEIAESRRRIFELRDQLRDGDADEASA
jgi:hypothetical protein